MIIARAKTDNGGELLILGLSRQNTMRMMAGQPVHIRGETHGAGVPAGWTIAIMYGETEKELYDQLHAAGMVDNETVVKVDPRLGIDTKT